MPTAAFHSHYWAVQTPPPPIEPGASGGGGYVPFQVIVTACLLFLAVWLAGLDGYT